MEPQNLDELLSWEAKYPSELIGNGILHEHGRAVLYGRYKSLKSMLAAHLAMCIGTGRPWLGQATPVGGSSVMYLQIEMPHMYIKGRIAKMVAGWDWGESTGARLNISKQCLFWTEHYIKLDSQAGLEWVKTVLEKSKPSLLIIDPLYKVLSGNILDPNAMRVFIDQLDVLIAQTGCSVLLVHHIRKGTWEEWGSDDMLGSVFLSAWADSVIKVSRGGDVKTTSRYIPLKLNFDVLRHAEHPIEELEVVFDSETLDFRLAKEMFLV